MKTYEKLCTADSATLEKVMREGLAPDLDSLAGWEFKGYNSLDLTSLLGFRKFKKGFYRRALGRNGDPAGPLVGYNVKIRQNPLFDEWVALEKNGVPVHHGFYEVHPAGSAAATEYADNCVLIDYGAGGNPPLDPSALLRDCLVQVSADDPDLYLGKAYLVLTAPLPIIELKVHVFVSYFVLQRHNPVTGKD
ncbi:hypothetical protein JW905_18180 [bacterium]|nr:hypothetical protein [candidate division CSSED10-310 bacterium]